MGITLPPVRDLDRENYSRWRALLSIGIAFDTLLLLVQHTFLLSIYSLDHSVLMCVLSDWSTSEPLNDTNHRILFHIQM